MEIWVKNSSCFLLSSLYQKSTSNCTKEVMGEYNYKCAIYSLLIPAYWLSCCNFNFWKVSRIFIHKNYPYLSRNLEELFTMIIWLWLNTHNFLTLKACKPVEDQKESKILKWKVGVKYRIFQWSYHYILLQSISHSHLHLVFICWCQV